MVRYSLRRASKAADIVFQKLIQPNG